MSSKQMAESGPKDLESMFSGGAVPAHINMDSNRGSDNVTMADLTIPRLEIIQDLSPQRKKSEPEYISGAEEGMIFNTVTRELFKDGVVFVPVFFIKEYVLWRDRKKGGGFCGNFPTEEEAARERMKLENPDDVEAVDTGQHYGLVIRPESTPDNPVCEEVVVSMSRTKMKVSRRFNTMIRLAGGDRFAKAYRLKSVADSNDNGSFYNWDIEGPLGFVPESVFKRAETMYNAVKSGQKAADYSDAGVDPNAKPPGADSDVETDPNI